MRVAALLLLLSSCGSLVESRTPHVVTVERIEVRAESRALAALVSSAIREALPHVQRLPGAEATAQHEGIVRVFEEAGAIVHGVTNEREMKLYVGRDTDPRMLRYIVAHELVHRALRAIGREWSPLPAVVEEGVCELIAQEIQPEFGVERRADHAVNLATMIQRRLDLEYPRPVAGNLQSATLTLKANLERDGLPAPEAALRLSHAELFDLKSQGQQAALTSFGFLVARRIGVQRLFELCREANERGVNRVCADVLFAEAQLDCREPREWMPAIRDLAPVEVFVRLAQNRVRGVEPLVQHAAPHGSSTAPP